MAKKMVWVYTCDVCGKETEKRFKASICAGSWDDDRVEVNPIERDLCEDCYGIFASFMNVDKIEEEPETTEEVVQEKSEPSDTVRKLTKRDEDNFMRCYKKGMTYRQIMMTCGMTLGQVQWRARKLKEMGIIHGEDRMEDIKETNESNRFRVVVDDNLFVQDVREA